MCMYYYHYGYYYCYYLEKTLSYTHFAQMESTFTIILSKTILNLTIQQQQHSLLSQTSWGRLEMKPKRDEKHEDT
jgi:hypothetical protein